MRSPRTIGLAIALHGAVVLSARAEEAHPRTDVLGGPVYLTPVGKFLLGTGLSGSLHFRSAEVSRPGAGVRQVDRIGGSADVGASLIYGIADRLRLGLSWGYQLIGFDQREGVANAPELHSSGFSDPELSIAYARWLESFPNTLLDLKLAAGDAFVESRAATITRSGNNVSGGPWATLVIDADIVDGTSDTFAVLRVGYVGRNVVIAADDVLNGSSMLWGRITAGHSAAVDEDVRWYVSADLTLPSGREFTVLTHDGDESDFWPWSLAGRAGFELRLAPAAICSVGVNASAVKGSAATKGEPRITVDTLARGVGFGLGLTLEL